MAGEEHEMTFDATEKRILEETGLCLGHVLGEGTYGVVFEATQLVIVEGQQEKEEERAVKVLDQTRMTPDYIRKYLPNEQKAARLFNHDHIIKFFGQMEFCRKNYFIMQNCSLGSIEERLHRFGPETGIRNKIWLHQLIDAIGYIHSLGCCHGDVKCENVLLYGRSNIKLADFTFFSSCVNSATNKEMQSIDYFVGTYFYKSPQMLSNVPYLPRSADIWAFAVVAYRIYTCLYPYALLNSDANLDLMKNAAVTFPQQMGTNIINFIKSVLVFEENERPKAEEISESPFF